MPFHTLLTDDDRQAFIRDFKDSSGGVEMTLDYLRVSKVVAGFDREGKMVCGYMLVAGPHMRWPAMLDQPSEFQRRTPIEHMMELNGVWLRRELRGGPQAASLWIQIGRDFCSQRIPYLTYVVDPRKSGLVRLYKRISSGIIYEGPVSSQFLPTARIYWSSRRRFQCLRILYIPGLLKRFLSGRRPITPA
jgi:hypothetical protein